MPTKPKATKNLNELNSADILNVTRNELGGTYADQVPVALKEGDVVGGKTITKAQSLESLRGIGDVIMQYQPLQNAFLSNLVNRIGRVIITSRLYENPWSGFKKGLLEYGETVEEIFVEIARPYQFDPEKAETDVFKRRIPDVQAAFHSMNYQKYYPTTVSNDQLRQAFLSWQGITDLIGRIIEQLYTGANYDEFLVMKYLIARCALDGKIATSVIPTVTADNARSVTTTMVAAARNLGYMSDAYNYAGVRTYTDPRYLYTILTTELSSIFDVEVLALSFNMDKAELIGRQIGVDGFGTIDESRLEEIFADDPYTTYTPFTEEELTALKSISGLMVDRDWFMIFDNYYNMTEIYNPEGLYWNYFYHVWKTFSISPFSNAILFTTVQPEITSVTISPTTATVAKGSVTQFTGTIEGTGLVDRSGRFKVQKGSAGTTISEDGLLTVSPTETNTELIVVYSSMANPAKFANATVTVTG